MLIDLLPIALLGAVLGMDVVTFPQAMFSRPIVAATLPLVGFLAMLQGLIAEVLMRTYFESQGRRPYRVKALVGLDAKSE